MRKATAISAGLHAAVLLWATLSFSGKTSRSTPAESLPVDLVSEKDFSQLTKGVKDAPKVETPKPLVDKKAGRAAEAGRRIRRPKITEKKEIQRAPKEVAPPPARAAAKPKPDPIARRRSSSRTKPEAEQKKVEPKPLPPKKADRRSQQPKFDADKIAALLDKREPQRHAATGPRPNTTPSLGAPTGMAAQLSQSRDRCAARALDGAVESAGRRAGCRAICRHHPHQASQRRIVWRPARWS